MVNITNHFTVGLTGGIGSGKSAASNRFKALGAHVIDTDLITHELTAPQGIAINAIEQCFGKIALNNEGGLNRAYMRELVFNNDSARQTLEDILHPLIKEKAINSLSSNTGSYNILVVPLLTEKPWWQQFMHAIVVVDCPETLQIQRVAQRSQLHKIEILKILRSQASRKQRLKIANYILQNNESLQHLHQQIDQLHHEFINAAMTKYKN